MRSPGSWTRSAQAGGLWLLLTGGEILLRRDFEPIYRHAKRAGFIVTLFTNGLGLSDRIADFLADYPPFSIEMTLYGASEETYWKVTQMRGGYARALAGIDRALARRLNLSLKTTLLSENAADFPAMQKIAEERGLRLARYTGELSPRIDDPGKPVGTRLSPREILAIDQADPVRWEQMRKKFTSLDPSVRSNKSEDLFICNAGVTGFHVNPYGKLLFCPSIEPLGYDLRRLSFAEAWRRLAAVRQWQAPKHRPCNACDFNIICGTCAGEAYLEHADPTSGVEYRHQLTRLRAEAFGVKFHEDEKGALVFDGLA